MARTLWILALLLIASIAPAAPVVQVTDVSVIVPGEVGITAELVDGATGAALPTWEMFIASNSIGSVEQSTCWKVAHMVPGIVGPETCPLLLQVPDNVAVWMDGGPLGWFYVSDAMTSFPADFYDPPCLPSGSPTYSRRACCSHQRYRVRHLGRFCR